MKDFATTSVSNLTSALPTPEAASRSASPSATDFGSELWACLSETLPVVKLKTVPPAEETGGTDSISCPQISTAVSPNRVDYPETSDSTTSSEETGEILSPSDQFVFEDVDAASMASKQREIYFATLIGTEDRDFEDTKTAHSDKNLEPDIRNSESRNSDSPPSGDAHDLSEGPMKPPTTGPTPENASETAKTIRNPERTGAAKGTAGDEVADARMRKSQESGRAGSEITSSRIHKYDELVPRRLEASAQTPSARVQTSGTESSNEFPLKQSEQLQLAREASVMAGQALSSVISDKGKQTNEKGKTTQARRTPSTSALKKPTNTATIESAAARAKSLSPAKNLSGNSSRTTRDKTAAKLEMNTASEKPTVSAMRADSSSRIIAPTETAEKSVNRQKEQNHASESNRESAKAEFSSVLEATAKETVGNRTDTETTTFRSSSLLTKVEQLQELRELLGQVLRTSQPLRLDKGSGLQFLWASQDWGPIQFIIGQHEQEVVARIQVRDANVKSLLETNREGLQQIFAEQGLRLDRFEIEATREPRILSIPEVRGDEQRRRQTRERELLAMSPWGYDEETPMDSPVLERRPMESRVWIA